MKFFIWILLFILLFWLWVYIFQRSMIYFPDPNPPSKTPEMQAITLKTQDGLNLISWYKPAKKGQPTILYFSGNAGNIGLRLKLVRPYLQKGFGVLLLGYRGYGGNPGRPSEEGLYQDMWAALGFLQKNKVPIKCIVLLGESLGSGLAVELASKIKVGALILLSPYTSLTDLGRHHYPFLPVWLMLKDRFDSFSKISSIITPLLILTAKHDNIVPADFSKRLYEAANPPKKLMIYNKVDHNILPLVIQNNVIDFLAHWQICKN